MQPKLNAFVFLSVLLMSPGISWAQADSRSTQKTPEDATLISPAVTEMTTTRPCGESDSLFRAVVIAYGFEHVTNVLYIQRLKIDSEQHSIQIAQSTAVDVEGREIYTALKSRVSDDCRRNPPVIEGNYFAEKSWGYERGTFDIALEEKLPYLMRHHRRECLDVNFVKRKCR